jgi:hypothetical protein
MGKHLIFWKEDCNFFHVRILQGDDQWECCVTATSDEVAGYPRHQSMDNLDVSIKCASMSCETAAVVECCDRGELSLLYILLLGLALL